MSPTVVARTLGADRCVILSLIVVAVLCLSHALAVVSDDDIVLTPWWGMRFATGEDAEIDCGVNTGGEANAVTIDWSDPAGKTIATNSSTRSVERDVDNINGCTIRVKVVSIGTLRIVLTPRSNLASFHLPH